MLGKFCRFAWVEPESLLGRTGAEWLESMAARVVGAALGWIPDNPCTAVTRACRYEPDLNRTYHEMAELRDRGRARPALQTARQGESGKCGSDRERWILAALRHRKFFALAELNKTVNELLERLNTRKSSQTRRHAHLLVS